MNPDWKDKYNEYQMLMQQLQQLEQNSEIIEKHVSDLNSLKENLGNVSKVKTNTESLLPIGNGIFLRGELKDSSSVVMNVGAGVLLEKSVKEAIDRRLGDTRFLTKIEIEVGDFVRLEEVLADGRVDAILLDNMHPGLLKEATRRIKLSGKNYLVEASFKRPLPHYVDEQFINSTELRKAVRGCEGGI